MPLIPGGTLVLTLLAVALFLGAVVGISVLLTSGASRVPYVVPATTPEDRLRALEALRKQGLITEAEYAARRQAIIESV